MPLSSHYIASLNAAGLDPNSVRRMSQLDDAAFLGMLMNDYATYGVVDLEEKQKLFRLLKGMNEEAKGRPRAPAPPRGPQIAVREGDLLDLDAHDGDLLSHACGPAMQLSPMGADKPRVSAGGAQQQQQAPGSAPSPPQEEDPPKIRVIVRKRPINRKEKERGEEDIVDCFMGRSCIVVNETKLKVDLTKYTEKHQFNFDESLDESVTNEDVYKYTVKPLVHTLFRNGKASCFAYGQTGSGKTYTMRPLPIRAAADIFRHLTRPEHRDVNLYVSCFEIYGNKLFDLLNERKKLSILEDAKKRVVVVGLREFPVDSVDFLKQLIEESGNKRSTGSTAANADSSRSHSIMQFALKTGGPDGRLVGKISFIDLAGSERGADTFDNNRQTRLEGAEINKSLLALKECIRALDSDARHVPFRGSKLTAVLRDSFIGEQARTVMIANISPNNTSVEHTLNTLRYADRVKELRKDKCERAPGGVTPGENPDYYAAVARADSEVRDRSPVKDAKQQRLRPPEKVRAELMAAPAAVSYDDDDDDADVDGEMGTPDDGGILSEHNRMLDTILVEEELLITAHRLHIEETMELVRSEMNLLTEVDQPGSAIDQYVDRLDAILKQKLRGVEALKAKLDRFKDHLAQEEKITATVRPSAKRF